MWVRRNVIIRLEICTEFGVHIALSWDVTSWSFVQVAKVSVLPVAAIFRLMEASGSNKMLVQLSIQQYTWCRVSERYKFKVCFLFVCLFICLSVYLFAYLFVCLLFVYFFRALNDSIPSCNYMPVPTNVGINTEYQF
jgi:hypothetical protein